MMFVLPFGKTDVGKGRWRTGTERKGSLDSNF